MVDVSHHERELVTMDRGHVERKGFLRKSPGMLRKNSIWPQNQLSLLVWTLRISSHSEKKWIFSPWDATIVIRISKAKTPILGSQLERPDTWVGDHFSELLMSECRLGLYPGVCVSLTTHGWASHHRLSMAKTLLQKLVARHPPWSHYLSLRV